MKNFTILFLTLTLVFAPTYQECCQACISKLTADVNKQATDSAALPVVKTYKVASKHADDVDVNGFCGKIFEKHGTCCNQADLKKRADAWTDRLKTRGEKIVKGFDKMDEIVGFIGTFESWITTNVNDIVEAAAGSERILQNETITSPFTDSNLGPVGTGKPKHLIKKPTADELEDIKAKFAKIKGGDKGKRTTREKNAKSGLEDCHKELMKMRKSALCMRCSGVASDYYNSATKSYKIKEDACSPLLEKCSVVFSAIAEANTIYTNLAILKKAKGGEVSADAEADVVSEEQLGKWLECGDDIEACLKDKAKVNDLCKEISLSIDNQALEGNLATASEGIATGVNLGENKEPGTTIATNFFGMRRLLNSKYIKRTLDDTAAVEDDGYGYAEPTSDGADLQSDFSDGTSGQAIAKIFFGLVLLVNIIVA